MNIWHTCFMNLYRTGMLLINFELCYIYSTSTDIAMISSADFSHNSRMYNAVKAGKIRDYGETYIDIIFDDEY